MTPDAAIRRTLRDYRALYHAELYERVVPFWLNHSLDREYGGYFNCLDEDGSVYDTRKHVWLQGREVWMMSRLHHHHHRPGEDSPYLQAARLGADFLRRHARFGDRCYFSLLRDGKPLSAQRKMFSECFYVMALAGYARASGDDTARAEAHQLFGRVRDYARNPALLGRPVYANGQPATSELAVPMILLNLVQELNGPDRHDYADVSAWCVQQIDRHYRPELRMVLETVGEDGAPLDTIEGRLLNPGHAIECGWFLLNHAVKTGRADLRQKALNMIDWSFDLGWDARDGGLFYFLDRSGRSPVQLEWSMKLWWPHNEALIAFLMAYQVTGEAHYLRRFQQVHDYAFARFPDRKHGEWYGYLDRRGEVTHRFKGGPYKGFFHVPRCLHLVHEMLYSMTTDP
jgi:N-acylglucosamine 2-epimerase